nr:hypothetical protein [Tanacetum cinerariifolium]
MSNDPISQEIGSGDRPRRQETTLWGGGTDDQNRFETVSIKSYDPPLSEVNISRSGEDKMEHPNDLTNFVPPTPHDLPISGGHKPRSDEEQNHLSTFAPFGIASEVPLKSYALVVDECTYTYVKGVAFRDAEELPRLTRSTTILQPLLTINPKDKGKGVLVEEELKKLEKVKRMDQGLVQIESDVDLAKRIYEEELAELDRA